MGQCRSFCDFGMEPSGSLYYLFRLLCEKFLRQSLADLGYFEGVGQPVVEDMAFAGTDNLGDGGKSSQGRRMENSVSIPLEWPPLILRARA